MHCELLVVAAVADIFVAVVAVIVGLLATGGASFFRQAIVSEMDETSFLHHVHKSCDGHTAGDRRKNAPFAKLVQAQQESQMHGGFAHRPTGLWNRPVASPCGSENHAYVWTRRNNPDSKQATPGPGCVASGLMTCCYLAAARCDAYSTR